MSVAINKIVKPSLRNLGGDLVIWWDASTLNLSDGATVAQIDDLSGFGNHAVQATEASKPTFETGEINGLPILRFNGTSQFIGALDSATFRAQNFSLFIVVKFTVSTTHHLIGDGNINTDRDGIVMWGLGGSTRTEIANASSAVTTQISSTPSTNDGSPHIISWLVDPSFIYTYVDGGSRQRNVRGSQTIAWNGYDFRIAKANGGGTDRFWAGDIAEVLFYNSAISDNSKFMVERYLANKYNISVQQQPKG